MVVVKALKPDVTLVHASKGDELGNILIPRLADWLLAIRASPTVIATVEERVAGPVAGRRRLVPGPGHPPQRPGPLPRGAAPTGYPGYYDLDEEQIALYLESAKDPAAWADYLQKYVLEMLAGAP